MKMIYIEPDDYFTESMKKILEEGNKAATKNTAKKTAKKQINEPRRVPAFEWLDRNKRYFSK